MDVTPKTTVTHVDKNFGGEFKGQSFEHHHFRDVNGRSAVFVDCDFSYCTFERAYFREATFKNCRFIGARFTDCNLRSAALSACRFDYALFRGTQLDAREFLVNLPEFPNVRVELLRSLRMNAHGLGDVKSVNLFVRAELASEREHWRRARQKSSAYYAQKYGSPLQRVIVYYRSFVMWIDWFLWGHGEHPWKLVRTLALLLLVFSFVILIDTTTLAGSTSISSVVFASGQAMKTTLGIFVGAPFSPAPQVAMWILCVLVALRLVSVSLFVGILFRRISRR